jgi:hypothetical protein
MLPSHSISATDAAIPSSDRDSVKCSGRIPSVTGSPALAPEALTAASSELPSLSLTAADESPGVARVHDELFFVSARAGGLGSYEIYSSRFTGLLGLGVAGHTSTKTLRFSDPASPAMPYLAACALFSAGTAEALAAQLKRAGQSGSIVPIP